jgi:hypothetical protein
VLYFDPAGTRALKSAGIGRVTSYRQYARVVVHRPDLVTASYLLHFFNGLDVWYPTPYVRDLNDRSPAVSLLEYTLLFLAIGRLVLSNARRKLGRVEWIGLAILTSPCLSAIPGVVEPRFFLPVQVLVYLLACFGPSTVSSFAAGPAARRMTLVASYGAFVAVCLTLSSQTRAQIEFPMSLVLPHIL